MTKSSMTVATAERLGQSWNLALRAERKAAPTLKTYGDGLRIYLTWCTENGVPPMDRTSLNTWVVDLLDTGSAASTVRSRQLAVRRFANWLTEEGELESDPFLGVKSPKLDEKVVEPLSDDDFRALLKACQPPKGADPRSLCVTAAMRRSSG